MSLRHAVERSHWKINGIQYFRTFSYWKKGFHLEGDAVDLGGATLQQFRRLATAGTARQSDARREVRLAVRGKGKLHRSGLHSAPCLHRHDGGCWYWIVKVATDDQYSLEKSVAKKAPWYQLLTGTGAWCTSLMRFSLRHNGSSGYSRSLFSTSLTIAVQILSFWQRVWQYWLPRMSAIFFTAAVLTIRCWSLLKIISNVLCPN